VYPGAITDDEDAPFPPDVERQFDEFLHDERVNVTEGNWDKFPDGSRLFIGKFEHFQLFAQSKLDFLRSSFANHASLHR
jgi:hypothetical protein